MAYHQWYATKLIPVLGLFMLLFTGPLSLAHALDIRVKGEATVRDDTVYLKDIARFHPREDARVSGLGRIEVASAPAPGRLFRLKKEFLRYKIGSALADKDDINLDIQGGLVIKRSAQTIDEKALEEIFREHVKGLSQWPEDRLFFEKIKTPGNIALPEGRLHWDVLEKGGGRVLGNVSLVVSFTVDGKQVRRVSLSGQVSVNLRLIKAGRKIKSGNIISKGDLRLVEENKISLREQTITDMDEVIGMRALRNIQEGQLINPRMFEDPPLVKKGKRVIIKAENKSVRVATIGKVLEDGRKGDQIRVLNVSSGKEVVSVVRGPGLVEVVF